LSNLTEETVLWWKKQSMMKSTVQWWKIVHGLTKVSIFSWWNSGMICIIFVVCHIFERLNAFCPFMKSKLINFELLLTYFDHEITENHILKKEKKF
jgi:hypothetical protein